MDEGAVSAQREPHGIKGGARVFVFIFMLPIMEAREVFVC